MYTIDSSKLGPSSTRQNNNNPILFEKHMPVGELTNGNHQRCHVGTRLPKKHSILSSLTQTNSCTRRTLAEPRQVPWPGSLRLSLLSRAPVQTPGFPPIFNGTDRTDRLGNTRILQRYARFLSYNNLPDT